MSNTLEETKTCTVDDCEVKRSARGFCHTHYQRLMRYGDAEVVGKVMHGGWQTPTNRSYHRMHQRCDNPRNNVYAIYGGRGIKIDPRWCGVFGFVNFLKDMGERPEGTSLDRIDPDGDYTPVNCRWSSHFVQNTNKRTASEHPGVYWSKAHKKWIAAIKLNRVRHSLGHYEGLEDAIKARKAGELKYLGHYVEAEQRQRLSKLTGVKE